jgi:AbrB family looped-hinge helix DNA binding protein
MAVNQGAIMDTVTVSPKFQVVIPQAVREALKLLPGEKMRVLHFGNRVELIRVRDARELRGALAGMDTAIERDGDRV